MRAYVILAALVLGACSGVERKTTAEEAARDRHFLLCWICLWMDEDVDMEDAEKSITIQASEIIVEGVGEVNEGMRPVKPAGE